MRIDEVDRPRPFVDFGSNGVKIVLKPRIERNADHDPAAWPRRIHQGRITRLGIDELGSERRALGEMQSERLEDIADHDLVVRHVFAQGQQLRERGSEIPAIAAQFAKLIADRRERAGRWAERVLVQ